MTAGVEITDDFKPIGSTLFRFDGVLHSANNDFEDESVLISAVVHSSISVAMSRYRIRPANGRRISRSVSAFVLSRFALGNTSGPTPRPARSVSASMTIEWMIADPATVDDGPVIESIPSIFSIASPGGTQL